MNELTLFVDEFPLLSNWKVNVDEEKINPIKSLYNECKEKGLIGQLPRLRNRILATILEDNKMCFLRTHKRSWGGRDETYNIQIVSPTDGVYHEIMRNKDHTLLFEKSPLSSFTGNIPPEVIRMIPPTLVKDAEVYYAARDPIITICIEKEPTVFCRDPDVNVIFSRKKWYLKNDLHHIGMWRWE